MRFLRSLLVPLPISVRITDRRDAAQEVSEAAPAAGVMSRLGLSLCRNRDNDQLIDAADKWAARLPIQETVEAPLVDLLR